MKLKLYLMLSFCTVFTPPKITFTDINCWWTNKMEWTMNVSSYFWIQFWSVAVQYSWGQWAGNFVFPPWWPLSEPSNLWSPTLSPSQWAEQSDVRPMSTVECGHWRRSRTKINLHRQSGRKLRQSKDTMGALQGCSNASCFSQFQLGLTCLNTAQCFD